MPRLQRISCLAPLLAAGCFVAPDQKPRVDFGATLASKFVHRGMTLVNQQVLQPHMDVELDAVSGGAIGLRTEGNIDLRNNTGAAWFPSGHAGRFTQIEMVADYSQKVGPVDLRGGIHSYNLPNGLEFQNGERGGTTELFVTASTEVLETTPYVSIHYDFDEVKSTYARLGLTESFDLGNGFGIELDGSLGYAGAGQAAWMYGLRDGGWADLRGTALLNYAYDERTTLELGLHGSMMVDNTMDAWFDQLGIDSSVYWASLGVNWRF